MVGRSSSHMIGGQGRALGHKMAVTLALARLPLPTALGLQLCCQHQWHEPPNDA